MSAHAQKPFTARVPSPAYRPDLPQVDDVLSAEYANAHATYQAALTHKAPEQHAYHPHHRSITHLLTALTPLIIGELIHDADKRWRWVRIGSLATAALGEVELCWQDRVRQREHEKERSREIA
jgi:hypothetical protein